MTRDREPAAPRSSYVQPYHSVSRAQLVSARWRGFHAGQSASRLRGAARRGAPQRRSACCTPRLRFNPCQEGRGGDRRSFSLALVHVKSLSFVLPRVLTRATTGLREGWGGEGGRVRNERASKRGVVGARARACMRVARNRKVRISRRI